MGTPFPLFLPVRGNGLIAMGNTPTGFCCILLSDQCPSLCTVFCLNFHPFVIIYEENLCFSVSDRGGGRGEGQRRLRFPELNW